MEHASISKNTQHMVAELLRKDEWFELHRVRIIEQNSEDLAFIIRERMEGIDGVVLVVATDSLRNENPATEATITVYATEIVTNNRTYAGFCTAIEAAEAAVETVDGEDWHWDGELRHETPGDNVLRASATFKGLVCRRDEGADFTADDMVDEDGNQ